MAETVELAKKFLEKRELNQSHDILSRIIEERPTTLTEREMADVYNTRGHIKYLWVDFDGAVKDYSEALSRDPLMAVAWYNRGQIHYRMGK